MALAPALVSPLDSQVLAWGIRTMGTPLVSRSSLHLYSFDQHYYPTLLLRAGRSRRDRGNDLRRFSGFIGAIMALSKHIVISASRAVSAATALSRTLPSMRRDCWTPTAITTCDHGYGTYRSDGRRHNSSTAIEAGSHKPNSALKRQDLFYKNLNPPENFPRTVLVLRLPRFAIHEDVQQIFEESGFPV
jgi:hypothetical protein